MPEHTEFAILRKKAGLSMAATAHLIGKSVRTAYRYESARTVPPPHVIEALDRAVRLYSRTVPDG